MKNNKAILGHLLEPLSALERLMKKTRSPWMIIGGVAASLLGKPRFTADVDVVVLIDDEDISGFLKSAERFGFRSRIANPIEFAKKNRILLLRHIQSAINIDISLGLLPFEKNAIKNRIRRKVRNLTFYLPTPEDLIIFKAVSHRPQDMMDIQEILRDNPSLNVRYIRRMVNEFADALEMPEIHDDIKAIIAARFRKK